VGDTASFGLELRPSASQLQRLHIIQKVFPPIFAKIGKVQRNLDSSETPICSRVWATYTYTKNLKKRINYLVYKVIILYLRYITTYGCSRL
jgi:hypothetical protein